MSGAPLVRDASSGLRRVRGELVHPGNWAQLGRFALVGGSGYAVNLAVFALCVGPLAIAYSLAAVIAFAVAVANNFLLNRRWTFRARDGRLGPQALRFLLVSVSVFAVTWAGLHALVAAGASETGGQAIAVACGTPVNFVANRVWTFSGRRRRTRAA